MGFFEKFFGKKEKENVEDYQSKEDRKYNELLEECLFELEEKNKVLQSKYKLGKFQQWDFKQEVGNLEFSNNGVVKVTCKVVVLGSFSNVTQTWMWGWANQSLLSHLTDDANIVKEYGEKNGITDLSEAKTQATEGEAWALGSYACRILNGMGIYCGPTGNGFILMMIKAIHEENQ